MNDSRWKKGKSEKMLCTLECVLIDFLYFGMVVVRYSKFSRQHNVSYIVRFFLSQVFQVAAL